VEYVLNDFGETLRSILDAMKSGEWIIRKWYEAEVDGSDDAPVYTWRIDRFLSMKQ